MTRFMAIKIHYDHRSALTTELKYSRVATYDEYQEYLALFRAEGIGGDGFHECLNYAIPESGAVRIYLPPTCLPDERYWDDDFVIFSFTYKGDKEMPARVVGVHAAARILNSEGIERADEEIEGVDPLVFHAEAPAEFVTLFSEPPKYNTEDGLYTKKYKQWGFGLRYIEEQHAKRIIDDSLLLARNEWAGSDVSKRQFLERQIDVLNRIKNRFLSADITPKAKKTSTPKPGFAPPLPDKDLGTLGEQAVYERELAYAKEIGAEQKQVKWLSRSVPSSCYDIESIRKTQAGVKPHYIEVKSSAAEVDDSIFVSSRQVEFFKDKKGAVSIMLVRFDSNRNLKGIRELTPDQLFGEFDLLPIKYRLRKRATP
jgi:hypothetical protein